MSACGFSWSVLLLCIRTGDTHAHRVKVTLAACCSKFEWQRPNVRCSQSVTTIGRIACLITVSCYKVVQSGAYPNRKQHVQYAKRRAASTVEVIVLLPGPGRND